MMTGSGAPPRRKVFVFLGHPAHYHMFKHVIRGLQEGGHAVKVVIKSKDILVDLLEAAGVPYVNLYDGGRGKGKLGIAATMLLRELRFLRLARRERPDLMIGTSAEISHAGALLGIPSVYVGEDDASVIQTFARICFPFVTDIVTPEGVDMGKWASKVTAYPGYQKLAYLHPARFTPDRARVAHLASEGERYFLLRLVRLTAHHDFGIGGFTPELVRRIITLLEPHGRVYISSELPLDEDLLRYTLPMDPLEIHHALAFAEMFVGDSQSMTVEACMLGTPSIRVSDFVGRISVLEELEHRYGLTRGVRPADSERIIDLLTELLRTPDLKEEWQRRRDRMLEEKVDVTGFLLWFIENYPASRERLREQPELMGMFASGAARPVPV